MEFPQAELHQLDEGLVLCSRLFVAVYWRECVCINSFSRLTTEFGFCSCSLVYHEDF